MTTQSDRGDGWRAGSALGRRKIRVLLQRAGIKPRKWLGQHFLADPNVARKICLLAGVEKGDCVIEPGPGVGSLTVALASAGAWVLAIEKDSVLAAIVSEVVPEALVLHADALTVDIVSELQEALRKQAGSPLPSTRSLSGSGPEAYGEASSPADTQPLLSEGIDATGIPTAGAHATSIPTAGAHATGIPTAGAYATGARTTAGGFSVPARNRREGGDHGRDPQAVSLRGRSEVAEAFLSSTNWKLVSNLPYSVGTSLFLRMLIDYRQIQSGVVMLQKEVAERLAAPTRSREASAPTVMLAYLAEAELVGTVGPEVFYPKPRVESSLLRFRRRSLEEDAPPLELVFTLVRAAFSKRRKTLYNSLSSLGWFGSQQELKQILRSAGVDATARPEEIGLEGFLSIASAVAKSYPEGSFGCENTSGRRPLLLPEDGPGEKGVISTE
jgi:16S rRNA A1518/A1519 N6-dimethyltransferase RsmA/KsgA/DIM1 with predicted DNA glycosylase/AP lyase activity